MEIRSGADGSRGGPRLGGIAEQRPRGTKLVRQPASYGAPRDHLINIFGSYGRSVSKIADVTRAIAFLRKIMLRKPAYPL